MTLLRALLLLTLSLLPVAAQSWDTSGNNLLNGTYYFRNVVYLIGDNSGNLSRAIALYGQITFSGSGTYSINAVMNDSNSQSLQNYTTTGTYSISASGYGFISHPLSSGSSIYGSVANDVFIGSDTEDGFNEFFVAARLASSSAGVSQLKGAYTLAYMELSSGQPYYSYDAGLQMSPDGAGNLGSIRVTGYIGSNGTSPINQTISGVKYIASNGAINMQFPQSQTNLLAGNEYMYLSPDGNFVFGGSPNGYDFFVGVRNSSSTPALSNLYYQGGIDLDDSTLGSGYGTLYSYYGAFSAGAGNIIGHQRYLDGFSSSALDYTYADSYTLKSDGTYLDTPTSTQYIVGTNGIRIGLGIGPFLGISAAIPVPSFSGSGVYLNPTGVVNAASSSPFTAGIAPGELITLYGTNLTASTVVAPGIPFPTTLGGTQVSINGTAAAIYYVSPTQVSVIVPFGLTSSIASIQVTNQGAASNTVSVYTNLTSPGVFTNPVGGIGYAAALHAADNTLVTAAKPAQVGEYISVYVTGLGTVSPAIADGAAGPTSPLSQTVNSISVSVAGSGATITYAGLAPQLAGLYQINFQVPAAVPSGNQTLKIDGPDSSTVESLLPVGLVVSAFDKPAPLARRSATKPRIVRPHTASTATPHWQAPRAVQQ